MKKSFLIPAIVLYVVRVAFSNNVQVGTVLFTTTDLVRRCWSDYDKSLLRARAIMQDVLPDPDCLDFSNPESIVILLDYFHTCYKIISISTYGKVQHLLFMALSDAFGGYLRAHVLPYTRKSYYAGVVKYSEAQKLFLLYDDIKSFLKTDGRGWPLPTKTPLRSFKVKPLVIKKGAEEACNLLSIIEIDGKRHYRGRKVKKSSKGKDLKLSKQRRRVQRQINDYNGTILSSHNFKNLSPQAEDVNENEDIASFRCCKKNRKPSSLEVRGAVSLGRRGAGNKEEVRKKELCKEELRKIQGYRAQARKEQARREEARREEASREEARKEAARKHESLKEEPLTEDPSAEDLCKTEAHKEEDHKESFSIEDLFKDEEAGKEEQNEDLCREDILREEEQKEESAVDEAGKEEEQKEDPSKEEARKEEARKEEARKEEARKEEARKEEARKEEARKEEARKEEARKEEEQKENHGRKETTKEEILKEESSRQHSHAEKESKNQQHFKGGILKLHSLKKSNKTINNTLQDDAPKEFSSTETPSKEYILKEVPCKEYILQEDSRKESSSTENPYKEYVLQEDPRKEYSSAAPTEEYKMEKEPRKEHSTTEISRKEYVLQENFYKEYSSTIPNKEYKVEQEPRKEHSTTEFYHKEYVMQENFSKEYFPTRPNKEYKVEQEHHKQYFATEIPHNEHSSTEGHYKEFVFQEEFSTGFPYRTESPSTENPCRESTFEKVCSKGDPSNGVFKEDDQTEEGSEEEYQTEESQTQEVPEEETREEEVISKNTLEELPTGDEVNKEETNEQKSRKCKGRKGKHRKHKSHKKKHRKEEVPKVKGQDTGFKKTVIVPLPVLDDYDCPTSIALPFKQRPLRNLKAASSAFILVNYYITVIKCFIAKGNRKRDIKDFNGQFQRWLTSKVLPLLGDEQWYPGFGGVLRVLETIKVFGADKSDKYKGEECEDTGFLFDEGAEFSVDSSFGNKATYKHRSMLEAVKADPMKGYMYAFILIFSAGVFLLLCGCLCYCRRGPSPEEHDMNYQENPGVTSNYIDPTAIVDLGGNIVYQEGKKNPYICEGTTPYAKPQTKQGGEVWSFGDARGMKHRQQHEAHFLTKHSRFPTEPRLLHNVHTLWKKPSNLMNRYWTSDETKCHKTEMRTMTCNCTESCHCTVVTDSSAVTKAKTRKSSTVTFFEADDDVAHPRRNTSTRSSTQYSTTESGSENFSSSEYSESSKSLRKHRNSTHYP